MRSLIRRFIPTGKKIPSEPFYQTNEEATRNYSHTLKSKKEDSEETTPQQSGLKFILARTIPKNGSIAGPATFLIPGAKIRPSSTDPDRPTVFNICYEIPWLTKDNASSAELSYSPSSEAIANSGSYPDCLAAKEASQKTISAFVYMGYLLSEGRHKEFGHNETFLVGKPWGTSGHPRFAKEFPEYAGLPVINYDGELGVFTDRNGNKIKFPNDVMSLENPEHCELADKAYKDHLGKLAEEYDLKGAHKQKMLKMEEESKKNPSSSPTYTDYEPVSREHDPWLKHFSG